MKLADIIKKYRTDHGVSMAYLAESSGLSKGYISMLESGRNPRNNNPISPTIDSLNKLSAAMGIDLDDLLREMDSDESVSLSRHVQAPTLTPEEVTLVDTYRQLTEENKGKVSVYASSLLGAQEGERVLRAVEAQREKEA